MHKIIVVVSGGVVQSVRSTSNDISADVLDYDCPPETVLEKEHRKELEEELKDMVYIW